MKRDVSSSTPAHGDDSDQPTNANRSYVPDQLLISAKEAAKMLGISPRLLWSMTAGGEIPHVRIRTRVLYSPQSLREWIAAREDQGGQAA